MPFMTRIPADLARFGLKVETVPGWETRGSSSFAPAGVVCHWTAGPRGTTTRPSLNVVVNGRTGLAGPLCNIYLARDGVCVVVAAGRSNHAGAGGWKGLVGNSAVYGIEAESAGSNDWTAAQRIAYPKLVAALLAGLGRDASWACGHNEWAPTRKVDINDWPMSAMRIAAANAAPIPTPAPEDPDMAALFDTRDQGRNVFDWFKQLNARIDQLHGKVDGIVLVRNDVAQVRAALTTVEGDTSDLEATLDQVVARLDSLAATDPR